MSCRRHVLSCVMAFVAVGPLACSTRARGPAAAAPIPVAARPLLETARSCHGEEREEHVFRTSPEWQAWLGGVRCGSAEAEPSVDFSSEVVIAVADRPAPNACHSLEIAGVTRDGAGLVVDVVRRVPGKDAICAQMLVSTAAAVAVVRSEDAVRFTWRDAPRDGGE